MSDTEENEDRRVFSRVAVHPRALLSSPDGADEWIAPVIDISLRGILIEGDCALDLDTEVSVRILLGDGPGDCAIEAKGRIVRKDARGTAVELTELEDPESFQHLRNLVLYNSTTPDPIEEEFRQHAGISRKVR